MRFADVNNIEIKKVEVDPGVHIQTFIMANPDKPTLVVVHGYAASGAIQYKTFKHLAPHFNLYVID
jgi:pimeloyl-ACP methyl ester carboxylesterase